MRLCLEIYSGCRVSGGEFDDEAGAALFTVPARDLPAVFLNDSVTHAEAQAHALPDRARGVEGIEHSRRIVHARSVIRELDRNRFSDCRSSDGQRSTMLFFHCVGGIIDD